MVQGHGVPDTLDGTGVASRTSLTACLRFMATFTVIVMAVFVVLLAHAEEPNPEERFNKILRAEEPTKQEGFEEILDEYQERLTADLESIKAVGEFVDECHKQQLDAQVAAFYTEKTRGEPESFLAWYGLGRALAMHGRYAEAKNILTRARPLVQDLPPAAVRLLVWCHANLKEHEESLRICKKYLKDNPDDAYCLRGACSALWALDRYDEAVEYGEKLVEIDSNPDNLMGLAESYYFMGKHEKAYRYYGRVSHQSEHRSRARRQMARIKPLRHGPGVLLRKTWPGLAGLAGAVILVYAAAAIRRWRKLRRATSLDEA